MSNSNLTVKICVDSSYVITDNMNGDEHCVGDELNNEYLLNLYSQIFQL